MNEEMITHDSDQFFVLCRKGDQNNKSGALYTITFLKHAVCMEAR